MMSATIDAHVKRFDNLGMDSSVRSVTSASCESDKFYTTTAWSPVKEKREVPQHIATLRVLGKNSVNVNMAMAELLNSHGCVVEHSEQFRDHDIDAYFQRVEFKYETMRKTAEQLEGAVAEVCGRLGLEFQLNWNSRKKNVCIMVSKYDHVLWEILLRHKAGELACNIPLIISNHEDLRPIADACLLYTSPSPRDATLSRMPSSA